LGAGAPSQLQAEYMGSGAAPRAQLSGNMSSMQQQLRQQPREASSAAAILGQQMTCKQRPQGGCGNAA